MGVICSDGVAAVTVAVGFFHAKKISLTSYSLPIGLKGGAFRIVLLSDIHLGAFVGEGHIRHMVDAVNRLQADAVVICGDIIDCNNHILNNSEALAGISAAFRQLHAKEGVFAVLGNHDPSADHPTFRAFLQASGIQLLHNQTVRLSRINLLGRTNARNNDRLPIDQFQPGIDPELPTVVLDHDPSGILEAAAFGADLVLCGHTHKGQFFPVTYLTKWANGKHFFYGHEQFGKTQAVISSGVGFFQLPIRLGTDNEIVDIRLT